MANAAKQRVMSAELRVIGRIDAARRERGMSQVALAELLGVSQPHVSRIIKGETPATLAQVFQMCAALGLDPSTVVSDV